MDIRNQTVSSSRIKFLGWFGGIGTVISTGTVVWLIRPNPEITEMTFPMVVIWFASTFMWTSAVGSQKWNELIEPFTSSYQELNSIRLRAELSEINAQKTIRLSRNFALGLMLVGLFWLGGFWGNQSGATCTQDSDGIVHCSNNLAVAAGFLVGGFSSMLIWFFTSQKFTQYLQYIKPQMHNLIVESEEN